LREFRPWPVVAPGTFLSGLSVKFGFRYAKLQLIIVSATIASAAMIKNRFISV
jgi:hypothetical protein